MAKQNLNTRVDDEIIERADALIEPVKQDEEFRLQAFGTVNRSAVIRLALLVGIESLEEKYGLRRGGGSARRQ